jgi:hypothetical protein
MSNEPAPQVNPEIPPDGSKFFLQSKTVWIAIVGMFLVPLLKRFGIELNDAQQQHVVEVLVQLMTVAGVIWGRSQAKGPIHFGSGVTPVVLAAGALTLMLGGCKNVTPQAVATSAAKVVGLALESYGAYSSGNPVAIAKAASDDLYGAAEIAHAFMGKDSVALVQGAGNAAAMASVVSQLPPETLANGKITPATAEALLRAADSLK